MALQQTFAWHILRRNHHTMHWQWRLWKERGLAWKTFRWSHCHRISRGGPRSTIAGRLPNRLHEFMSFRCINPWQGLAYEISLPEFEKMGAGWPKKPAGNQGFWADWIHSRSTPPVSYGISFEDMRRQYKERGCMVAPGMWSFPCCFEDVDGWR